MAETIGQEQVKMTSFGKSGFAGLDIGPDRMRMSKMRKRITKYGGKSQTGTTLIEVMVAIMILVAAVLGATRYRYYTALDARRALLRIEASRLAVTMLEAWKGAGSETDFNPLLHLGK